MKLDAVGVVSSDFKKTVEFYTLLGYSFSPFKDGDHHLEPKGTDGSARLMIDSKRLITNILGEEPRPGNTSAFALKYETPVQVNEACRKIKDAGFKVVKEPWDAFWGQRYAVVEDPDGYRIDLFASL